MFNILNRDFSGPFGEAMLIIICYQFLANIFINGGRNPVATEYMIYFAIGYVGFYFITKGIRSILCSS